MFLRWAANLSFLLGLGLLGLAVGMYLWGEDGPGVTIDEPQREGLTVPAGQTGNVAFRMHNPTRHVARVVGLGVC